MNTNKEDRWAFFTKIESLLSRFPHSSTGEKAALVAMSLGAVLFLAGLVGQLTLPAWAVVVTYVTSAVLIFGTAGVLLWVERHPIAVARCRQIPVFPPSEAVLESVNKALSEIRDDASVLVREQMPAIQDEQIRANIFLLAKISGGDADGEWRLVVHEKLCINMDHLPERHLQFCIGQGATGVTFRDGRYQLTRRQASDEGDWDCKYQMTPELDEQVHKSLKWIVSFPLLKPNTSEAIGVLNVDGLGVAAKDDLLHEVAGRVRGKVQVIATNLSLQASNCVGIDQLGVMEHA